LPLTSFPNPRKCVLIKSLLESVSDSIRQRSAPSTMEIPLFPLGSILFPEGAMALKIFEARYMDMAKAALKAAAPFGIVLIREGEEVGAPASPHSVGTMARIGDWDMPELGVLQVQVRGEGRFRIRSQAVQKSGLIIGTVEMVAPDSVSDCPELAPCANFLKKVLLQVGREHEDRKFDDASWVSFRITELLPFSNTIKQKMLELTDARMRLEVLYRFLREQKLAA